MGPGREPAPPGSAGRGARAAMDDPDLDATREDGPGDSCERSATRCAPGSRCPGGSRVRAECASPFVTEDGASDTPCQCSAVMDLLGMSRDFGVSEAFDPAHISYCDVELKASIG